MGSIRLLKALAKFSKDALDDLIYWIEYSSIHPRTRRFICVHLGLLRTGMLQILGCVAPTSFYNGFVAKLIKTSCLFDSDYYLRTNLDVTEYGLDPLLHYVRYGDREGRCPNPLFEPNFYRAKAQIPKPDINSLLHYSWIGQYLKLSPSVWFDTQYYLQHNRDVERWGVNPLLHYLRWGGLEGRSPNPSFDGSFYIRTYPEVVAARLNPLIHYIECGRVEGCVARPGEANGIASTQIRGNDFWQPGAWDKLECKINRQNGEPQVAVVIPVYRDRRLTWRCLASVLTSSCDTAFSIVVIDDASPEPDLSTDMDEMARYGWIKLLRNTHNRGFVSSVNRGLDVANGLDVVLLNADTEVYPGWLDRMRQAAWRNQHTASVTPLSNNATIASYPRFLHDNPYPLEIDYPMLDRLASETNAGVEVEVPTGVGFCMYLRRDALNQIGCFDEEAFGKGYGEENDWCQRASQLGWRNIITTDTFVRHFGGVSFQGEKAKLIVNAMKKLNARYPTYRKQVMVFSKQDPLYSSRERLDWARLQQQVKDENVLIACHNRGGGSERHVQEDAQRLIAEGKGVFYIRPVRGMPTHVRFAHPRCRQLLHSPRFAIADTSAITAALRQLRITNVNLHGLVDMIPEAVGYFLKIVQEMKIPLDVDIHDYKVICPRINLVNNRGFYCGEPNESVCDNCLETCGNDFGVTRIGPWRQMHHRVLRESRNIWVPDEDVAKRLARYYPGVSTQISPHENINSIKLRDIQVRQADEPQHVVVIGAISKIKGYDILLACARESQRRRLPIRFTVMGYSMDDRALEVAGVKITGRYQESEAEARLHALKPNIVWLPAVWPETYSYTLSIALQAGYPSMVYDIGAPAARLRRLGLDDWVLPFELASSATDTLQRLMSRGARVSSS